jgi:hypothetical protein
MSEHTLQRDCAAWLGEHLRLDVAWTSVDAATRSAVEGQQKKARGVHKGWPDMQFVPPGGVLHAIELKRGAGRLSPAQRALLSRLAANGSAVAVCRSLADVVGTVEAWGLTISG